MQVCCKQWSNMSYKFMSMCSLSSSRKPSYHRLCCILSSILWLSRWSPALQCLGLCSISISSAKRFQRWDFPQSPLIIRRRRWWPPRRRWRRWRGCCIRRRCRCRPPPCRCRCSSCNSPPRGCCSPSCQFHYRVMYCSIELASKWQCIILFDRFSITWGIPKCLYIWVRPFCTRDWHEEGIPKKCHLQGKHSDQGTPQSH